MKVTWVKACLWDILKFCLLVVTCLEVYSTEFWELFAVITCTFLMVIVQKRIFHLIYVKVLILISCCVFQALCKMCLFSQTQRLPNTILAVKHMGSRGEWVADVLPLMKGEQGCLEEGCLWLMEQDSVRCIVWTLKSLEDRDSWNVWDHTVQMQSETSPVFTWEKIWNKWPGLVSDHKVFHIHIRVNAATVSLEQLHSYGVLKPPKASEEDWHLHNFPLKIHAC